MHSETSNQPAAQQGAKRVRGNYLSKARMSALVSSWIFAGLVAEAGLICGLWFRWRLFRSFPDPLATPDSWSYLTGTFGLLENGRFDLFSLRTPGFPLLTWITLVVFRSFAALNLVHGALTLLSAFAVAFVVRAFDGKWLLAALVFTLLALNSHLLFWEHFLMTEGSFHALFTLALCATALAILKPTIGRAAIAGALTAITVLIRPQGLFLAPLMLLALIWSGWRLGRRKIVSVFGAAAVGLILLLGGWSTRNFFVHGFFGLSNIGPLQIFGVSARWIDLESPRLAEDKALIADSIRLYRSMPEDLGWAQYAPDGPAVIIARKYGNDERRRDEVFNALAREAILHHPFAFIQRGLSTSYRMMTTKVGDIYYDFAQVISWDREWDELANHFQVNKYRAALDQARFPMSERERTFTQDVVPIIAWHNVFIRMSLVSVLLALMALPFLSGRLRVATALSAVSVVLLVLSAGFLSDAENRYLAAIHGSSILAGALALTGLFERWRKRGQKNFA
jgi:hypothetical protein